LLMPDRTKKRLDPRLRPKRFLVQEDNTQTACQTASARSVRRGSWAIGFPARHPPTDTPPSGLPALRYCAFSFAKSQA
jgi:hypothetical protein